MDEETRRQAASDRAEARRANNWRPVSFRSLGQISDVLIERMQAHHAANDNKPARLARAPAHTREADE